MQQPYGQPPPHGGHPPQGYGYAPQGPQPPPKKGMSTGMIVVVVMCCLFGGCMVLSVAARLTDPRRGGQANTSAIPQDLPVNRPVELATAPTVAEKPKTRAVPVSATQLFADYQGNEVSADDKYKGKKLLVSGSIASVDKDFTGSIIVRLRTSNQFMPVDATLEDSEKAKAGKLTKGESTTVRCEGNGMVLGRPQLGDCTIE